MYNVGGVKKIKKTRGVPIVISGRGVCVCVPGGVGGTRGGVVCPRGALREVVAFPRYTPCPRGDTREIKYNKQYGSKWGNGV